MLCPFCGSDQTQVLETRDAADALRRRRLCGGCERRFTTYERVEALALCVRKRDGEREAFDRDKLMRGLLRAAAKRPVGVDALEHVVDRVADELRVAGGELGSERIGERVLLELRGLDPVAYVRFASVYRNFADAAEFSAELERLESGGRSAESGPDSVRPGAEDAVLPAKARRAVAKHPQIATTGEE
ncbi:MAG TPA: transcriptional regulator NrdR [Solirubrobacteraceae bacterium]|jgi:transcriptional repressor NrdR|nr:transcriptional regulator NrdR [Solirubrobacteraceae bacterium]